MLQELPPLLRLKPDRPLKHFPVSQEPLFYFPDIIYRQLSGGRRGWGAHVSHKIRDRCVRLMAHCRDDRDCTVKNSPRHRLLIERPQILDAPAAAADNDHIHLLFLQGAYPPRHALCRAIALDLGRIQDQLHIRIAPARDIDDIPDRSPGRRSDDANSVHIPGDRLLVLGSEHAHLREFLLQRLKAFIQRSHSVAHDLPCVELVFPVSLIDAH